VPVPGVSSALAALSVAGDTSASGFLFAGFLPTKGAERAQALQALATRTDTQVLFEAPHRIEALAVELARICGPRRVTLCRELTKQFEDIVSCPASELPAWVASDDNRRRGEFALVLHSQQAAADDGAADADQMLRTLLAELPLKQAVSLAASLSGRPRNALYERALTLKRESSED
jgi:16S rRNA (cytidine1402-2'-O)-methyltransferase